MRKFLTNNKSFLMILLLFVIFLFTYSVYLRKPWRTEVFSEEASAHHWVTAHTLLVARQWYSEGPFKLNFGLTYNPKSIEFPNLLSREPYFSFPSGMVWPIYLISKIRQHFPSIEMLQKYNLFNHLLISLILTFSSYIILYKNNFSKSKAFLISCFVSPIILFSPGPFYFFQNTYFSQEAVILPYCLIILFEIFKYYQITKKIKILNIIESIIIFYALYTDWLAIFIVFVLFLNNLFYKKQKIKDFFIKNTHLIIPLVLFTSLFIYQTLSLSGFEILKERFFLRIGLNQGKFYATNFFHQFWGYHSLLAFGLVDLILLLLVIVIFGFIISYSIFRKNDFCHHKKSLFFLICLILLPNILEIYTFKNHSFVHNFSSLKLIIPISLSIPLILSFIKTWLKTDLFNSLVLKGLYFSFYKKNIPIKFSLFFIPIIIFCIFIIKSPQKFKYFPIPNYLFNDISIFVNKNTGYNDVVFSPNFRIPTLPPQRLSLSLKRVYFIEDVNQINKKVNETNNQDVIINLLVIGNNYKDKNIQKLISYSIESKEMIVNNDQKQTIITDLFQNSPESDTQQKVTKSIKEWTNNKIYLYKIDYKQFIKDNPYNLNN